MVELLGPEGVNFFGRRGVNAADPIHDKDVVNLRSLRHYVNTATGSTSGGTGSIYNLSAGTAIELISGGTKVTIRHTLWESGRTSAGGSYSSYLMPIQLQNSQNISNSNWSIVAGSGNTINAQSNFSGILGGQNNQNN